MDEDTKTLLAILALIYGSSNGLGLFKVAIDPVKSQTEEIKKAMDNPGTALSTVRTERKKLLRALFSLNVLIYVTLVLLLPAFLALVVWLGAQQTLQLIGLDTNVTTPPSRPGSLFYWILLSLSLITTLQLISEYMQAWRGILKSLRWKPA